MKAVTLCPSGSYNHWGSRFLCPAYRVDNLRQFFRFLPKKVIDAHVEQYHLDKYAKKIYFRPFMGFVILTLTREKKGTLRKLQSMTKNKIVKVLTGMEQVSLSRLSAYINSLKHRNPHPTHKNTGGEIRKPADQRGEKTTPNIRHHMDDNPANSSPKRYTAAGAKETSSEWVSE